MLCMAMDELETATVREISAHPDLQRLQDLQHTFRSLQQSFVDSAQNTVSPFKIDNNARAFAIVDGLLAYASMKRLRRLMKCPTVEEVGHADGLWTSQAKVDALKCRRFRDSARIRMPLMAFAVFMHVATGLAGYV